MISDDQFKSLKPGDIIRTNHLDIEDKNLNINLRVFAKFKDISKYEFSYLHPNKPDHFVYTGLKHNIISIVMRAQLLCNECLIQPVCDKPKHAGHCYNDVLNNSY